MTTPANPADLITWLRAQLDDDERAARAWLPLGNPTAAERDHIARHDPARVLAEVDAKRRILDEHGPSGGDCRRCCQEADMQEFYDHETETETVEWERREMSYPCTTIRLLALPYADREGFREGWRA